MEKKIAFITNHFKTPFFLKTSNFLEKSEIYTYWITPSTPWASYLIEEKVNKDHILNLAETWVKEKKGGTHKNSSILFKIEKYLPYSIKTIIQLDRILRKKETKYALGYLASVASAAQEFLSSNQITSIISEQTWAVEIIISGVAKLLGITSLVPATMRIPSNRFLFFSDSLQEKPIPRTEFNKKSPVAEAEIATFREKNTKPGYFYANNKKPTLSTELLKKFFKHIKNGDQYANGDETVETTLELVKTHSLAILRKHTTNLFLKEMVSTPPEGSFVFVTLHRQPEASIDLLDYWNSDQLNFIAQLSTALPLGYKLVVKEHSNAIGNRGYRFFNALSHIPNVILANYNAQSKDFVLKSEVVISVSGTVCFEAGLLGKKAICTSKPFFSNLLSLSGCSIKEIADHAKDSFARLNAPTDQQINQEYERILNNSYLGTISDIKSDPSIISEENIRLFGAAILSIL